MKISDFLLQPGEKPLDNIVTDGGFCGIFRKIGCIGDSLSSGEMESLTEDGKKGYHDYFEYSWGQYMARDIGCEALNFSRGGMTAREYCQSFAGAKGFWNPELACQAYIIALGVNDISRTLRDGAPFGDVGDIDMADWHNNKETFVGFYAQIIQRMKEVQPKAKFFLVTIPRNGRTTERTPYEEKHRELLYAMAELFDYTYVIDLRQYAPVYDAEFDRNFHLGGHLNAAGYRLTAKMFESYIDYIIRANMADFSQVAFIGKGGIHNCGAPW